MALDLVQRKTYRSVRDFGEAVIGLDPGLKGEDPEEVGRWAQTQPEFADVRIVEDKGTAFGVLTDPGSLANVDPGKASEDLPSKFAGVMGDVLTGLGEAVTHPIDTLTGMLHLTDQAVSLGQARALESSLPDLPRERAEEIAAPLGSEGIDPNAKDLLSQLSFGLSAAGLEEDFPRFISDVLSLTPARAGLGAASKSAKLGSKGQKLTRGAEIGLNVIDPTTALFEVPAQGAKLGFMATAAVAGKASKSKAAQYFAQLGRNVTSQDVPLLNEMTGSFLGFTTSLGRQFIEEMFRRAGEPLHENLSFDDVFRRGRQAPTEEVITEVVIRGQEAMDRINDQMQKVYNDATQRAFAAVDDVGIPTGSMFDDLRQAAGEFGVRSRRVGFSDDVGELRQARIRPEDPLEVPPTLSVEQIIQELEPQLRRQQGIDGRQQVLDEVRRIATGAPPSPQNPTLRQAIEQMIASDLPAGSQGSLAQEAMRIIRQETRPVGRAQPLDIGTEAPPTERVPKAEKVAAEAQERLPDRFQVDPSQSEIAEIGANRAIVTRALERFLNMQEARVGGDDLLSSLRAVGRTEGLEPSVLDARELHRLRKLLDDDISALSATSDVSRRTRSILSDMRDVVAAHLEGNLGARYSNAMKRYEKGIKMMDETAETLGFRPGMISKNGQLNPEGFEQTIVKLSGALSGKESHARRIGLLNDVQTLANDDQIAPLFMGAAARNLHGSGLVVRSEMAQILRSVFAAGAFTIAGAPALVMFSPRVMTELILETNKGMRAGQAKLLARRTTDKMNALDKKTGGQLRREMQRAGWRMTELYERLQIEEGGERMEAPDDLMENLSEAFFGSRPSQEQIDTVLQAR